MEIKIGEYVRSHTGTFGKVTRIESNSNTQFLYEDETLITIDKNVVKHNFNIIDLIEIGDIVKYYSRTSGTTTIAGVFETCTVEDDIDKGRGYITTLQDDHIYLEEIESIMSHEDFEDILYKVKED